MSLVININQKEIREQLQHIRKESLDLYNRLHSIEEDVTFVKFIYLTYANLNFPILPNLRCGAWYSDPSITSPISAYFKSTDGHYGNWSFNLRRANLHLLPIIVENDGLMLVDSTRAGKRIPDALSKTVPIWCAVINRTISLRYSDVGNDWDTCLYTPPGAVSTQEHHQIEQRLNQWAEALKKSSYSIPRLARPLRPFWITPATSVFPSFSPRGSRFFSSIICISASKQINAAFEQRAGGYSYVQGSGDDHELWAMGLTPKLFWQKHSLLLNADRSALPDLVVSLVSSATPDDREKSPPSAISKVQGLLLICSILDLPADQGNVSYVIVKTEKQRGINSSVPLGSDSICLEVPEGKKGHTLFLQKVLPESMRFIQSQLYGGMRVCIACASGKEHGVGVALAALQIFFDDDGGLVGDPKTITAPSKASIRTRLEWIISSRPQANPSRSILQRVNEFLLTDTIYQKTSQSS